MCCGSTPITTDSALLSSCGPGTTGENPSPTNYNYDTTTGLSTTINDYNNNNNRYNNNIFNNNNRFNYQNSNNYNNNNCQDKAAFKKNSDCALNAYLCDDPIYYNLMTKQCPQTCNRCALQVNYFNSIQQNQLQYSNSRVNGVLGKYFCAPLLH